MKKKSTAWLITAGTITWISFSWLKKSYIVLTFSSFKQSALSTKWSHERSMWVISDKMKQRAAGWYLVHIFICPCLMISLNGHARWSGHNKKKREILKYDILCLSGAMHSCAVQYWPSMTMNKRKFFCEVLQNFATPTKECWNIPNGLL